MLFSTCRSLIKDITERLLCQDSNVRSYAPCHDLCVAGFEYCEIPQVKKTSCQSLILQEEKWLRRVSALGTAIDIYLDKPQF